jgi:hypothetical protein
MNKGEFNFNFEQYIGVNLCMNKIKKALNILIISLIIIATFTGCNGQESAVDVNTAVDSEETEFEGATGIGDNEQGIFIDFNKADYSVDMALEEIYSNNDIAIEDIGNIFDTDSGLYYDIELELTNEQLDMLCDATGAYVAKISIPTCEIIACGDELDNVKEDSSVTIIFGDKDIIDLGYIKSVIGTDGQGSTRILFVRGIFRGETALYPMLVEVGADDRVYVFKSFLEMSSK